MPLDNCKRCGTLFQNTLRPICNPCFEKEQKQNQAIYRYIHSNPGVTLEELAQQFNLPTMHIEGLVKSGVLGTASELIRSECARCKIEITHKNRIGYFCKPCHQKVEQETLAVRSTPLETKSAPLVRSKGSFPPPTEETHEAASKKPDPPTDPATSFEEEEKRKAELAAALMASKNEPQVAKFGFKRISH